MNQHLTPLWHPLLGISKRIFGLVFTTIFIAACAIPTRASADFLSKMSAQAVGPGAVVQTEQVRAELVAHAPDGVGSGKTVLLGLQLQHQPDCRPPCNGPFPQV